MAWFARAPALDVTPPFAALLPHSLLLDAEAGILLLATPRWRRPGLALGCAWAIEPRNIEVCDETVCLEIARLHESLLRSLPVGGALQGLLTIRPTHTAPAWETLRHVRPGNARRPGPAGRLTRRITPPGRHGRPAACAPVPRA